MKPYLQGATIPADGFTKTDPALLGGTAIEGDARLYLRVDLQTPSLTGGIFEQNAGKFRISWPATEHSFVLEGQVTITDAGGWSQTFRPGDGFMIRKGDQVTWDVKSERFRKAFMFLNPEQE